MRKSKGLENKLFIFIKIFSTSAIAVNRQYTLCSDDCTHQQTLVINVTMLTLKVTTLSQRAITLSLKVTTLSQRARTLSLKVTTLSQRARTLSLKVTTLSQRDRTLSLKVTTLSLKVKAIADRGSQLHRNTDHL